MLTDEATNLLFVMTDQQTANTLAAYGNNRIGTPNMNKLAERSFVFRNCYCTQPVCTPARSSLMTGLYPHSNGCIQNDIALGAETPCLPELTDFSRYTTGYFGKWHLGDEVFTQHGFQSWRSVLDSERKYYSRGRDRWEHSTYYHFLTDSGYEPDVEDPDGFQRFSRDFCARLPERFSKPAYLAREAVRFISENRDNPFVLYLSFFEPHPPNYGPRDGQYDPAEVPLPENFHDELSTDKPLKTRLFRLVAEHCGASGLPLKTERDWQRYIANYWGLVSLIDEHLGSVLKALEENDLFDRTIIIYTSDHGDMMGAHQLEGKCTMFEEAVRVPMLLKVPEQRSKKTITHPVSHIDLVPTLLDLMGKNPPGSLQGFSWLPFLTTPRPLAEKDVYIEWNGNHPWATTRRLFQLMDSDPGWGGPTKEEILEAITAPVRTLITPDGWKYNWSAGGEQELYNLRDDPGEIWNMASETQHYALIKGLREKIRAWQKRTGDGIDL